MVDIRGLKRSWVLMVLYNSSRVQGLGFLQATGKPMTVIEAEELLEENTYFDYLHGKVMKVDLSSDESFEERLYDRDNGEGAAQRVIDKLRKKIKNEEINLKI